MKDYYKILGISPDADQLSVKKAYREKAIKHYQKAAPSSSDNSFFIDLTEAYEVLSDEQRRSVYDRMLNAGSTPQQPTSASDVGSPSMPAPESAPVVEPAPVNTRRQDHTVNAQSVYDSGGNRVHRERSQVYYQIDLLYSQIKEAGAWVRFKNRVRWRHKAVLLRREFNKHSPGETDSNLDYIDSNQWVPPLVPVAVVIVVLAILSIFFFIPLSEPRSKDTDNDGVADHLDEDPETKWLLSALQFPLKDYVDTKGRPDTALVKKLLYEECSLIDSSDLVLLQSLCSVSDVIVYESIKYRVVDRRLLQCGGDTVNDCLLIREIGSSYGIDLMVPDPPRKDEAPLNSPEDVIHLTDEKPMKVNVPIGIK